MYDFALSTSFLCLDEKSFRTRRGVGEVGLRGQDIYDLTMYDVRFCKEDDREDKEYANEMMIDVLVDREVIGKWTNGADRAYKTNWTDKTNKTNGAICSGLCTRLCFSGSLLVVSYSAGKYRICHKVRNRFHQNMTTKSDFCRNDPALHIQPWPEAVLHRAFFCLRTQHR